MKKQKSRKSKFQNLRFVFRYAKFTTYVDDDLYSDEEKADIENAINICSRRIEIDKTYVDFAETPYRKTFLTEKGWNNLCKLVAKTDYGNKCTTEQHDTLQTNYALMMLCYLYQVLEDLGYSNNGICIELKERTRYMVEIFKDDTSDNYYGKWQTWK